MLSFRVYTQDVNIVRPTTRTGEWRAESERFICMEIKYYAKVGIDGRPVYVIVDKEAAETVKALVKSDIMTIETASRLMALGVKFVAVSKES